MTVILEKGTERKLQRAAAKYLGIASEQVTVLGLYESRNFSDTEWLLVEDDLGNVSELPMWMILDTETEWYLDPSVRRQMLLPPGIDPITGQTVNDAWMDYDRGLERHGVSGDMEAFRISQMMGPKAARAYSVEHGENVDPDDETEAIRQRLRRNIRTNLRRMEENERRNQLEGNSRLVKTLVS